MRLKDIQANFKKNMTSANIDLTADSSFLHIFKNGANDQISTTDRLKIYRNNFTISLINLLMSRHEVIRILVGDDFMRALARSYIRANPPQQADLNGYGYDIPSFAESLPQTASLPYLGDVMRLECAWWRAYYAPDAPPLDPGLLSGLSADEYHKIRFTMHPSLRLIRSDYPVFSIWAFCAPQGYTPNRAGQSQASETYTPNGAMIDDNKTQAAQSETQGETQGETQDKTQDKTQNGTLNYTSGAEYGIIARPYLRTDMQETGEAQLKFLVYLRNGHTIGEAYGKILARFPYFNLKDALQAELARGSFTAFSI